MNSEFEHRIITFFIYALIFYFIARAIEGGLGLLHSGVLLLITMIRQW